MKKKKIIFIVGIIIVILISLLFLIVRNTKDIKCNSFTGGGFELVFNTTGGNDIDPMHVCIACSPSSYQDLPISDKNGYIFDGWYYDKKLTNKVDGNSSINVIPVRKINKYGCHIGYENVNLYAKWIK